MDTREPDSGRDPLSAETMPARMGEFRLRERLGAGGMGVVYLAFQESLQRDVALKVILPVADARERFRREVEAVAKLNHPGIVPVYSVGEEGGRPYFAMELVEGCTLAAVIDELKSQRPELLSGAHLAAAISARTRRFHDRASEPSADQAFAGTWVQAVCRLVLQVADALQHAHERGIVHRDVKPSNVVVTPGGRAMLIDFGLASDLHGDRITRTGALAGSMPYMPPERARGGMAETDARGDVYSLGVTFYELLALRLPFEQSSIQDLLDAIREGQYAPLRSLNSSVPWDAATVCATAMERDLGRRYAGAGALARDLRNLLELRPILAQPPGARLRAKRWIQRHPTASVAAALGFLLIFVAPSVAGWRIARERDAALAELRGRESVVDFLLDLLNAADPEASGRDANWTLEEVVENGVRIIRNELEDYPRVRSEVLRSLARIQGKLGRPAEALAMAQESAELARTSYGPDDPRTVACERVYATELVAVGRIDEALVLLRHGRDVVAGSPGTTRAEAWQYDLDIGTSLVLQKRWEEALAILETFAPGPGSPLERHGHEHVTWLESMAEALQGVGRFDEAEQHLRDAVDLARRLWGRQHLVVANTLLDLATFHVDRGRPDEAMPELIEAREIRATLRAKESVEDARLAHNLGSIRSKRGELDEALADFSRALELSQRLAGESMQTARAGAGAGAILFKLGRYDEAEAHLRDAVAASRRFIARKGIAGLEAPLWLARTRAKQGFAEESAELWKEVLACAEGEASVPPALVLKFESEYAEVLDVLGRVEEAAQLRARSQGGR